MEKFRGGMWFSAKTGWILQDFGKNRRSPLFQKQQLLFGGNVLSLIMTNIQFSPDEKVFL